jgi:exonuclease III
MTIWTGDLNVARTPYDVHFGDARHTPKGIRLHGEDLDASSYQTRLEKLTSQLHHSDAMVGIGERVPAGFTKAERDGLQNILDLGYTDTWRHLNPYKPNEYNGFTWWNLRIPAYRPNNRGWRIDYVIIDNDHIGNLVDCRVLAEVGTRSHDKETPKKYGSDHAPICATIRWKMRDYLEN